MMKILIRAAAILLFVLCVKEAAANFLYFKAVRAAHLQERGPLLEKAVQWSPRNPRYRRALGETLGEKLSENVSPHDLEPMLSFFEELASDIPYYGKGWLYRAEARLRLEHEQTDQVSDAVWQQAEEWLGRAKNLMPGNAWIYFRTGLNRLLYRGESAAERALAFSELKKAAGMHPSGYLSPALEFLWQRYGDPRPLLFVVPPTYEGYEILRTFSEKRGLWELRERIGPKWLRLRTQAYNDEVQKGEAAYREGNFHHAYFYFEQAFWIDSSRPAAKAGMMIAKERLHGKIQWDYSKVLKEILENKDDADRMEYLLSELRPLVRQYLDDEKVAAPPPEEPEAHSGTIDPLWKGQDMKNSVLDRKGRMGTVIRLQPGPAVLTIAIRKIPESYGRGGFVHVRLGEVLLGSLYVDHQEWENAEFRLNTAGGKRWLNLELVNGAEKGDGGPALELGQVGIHYGETKT